MKRALAVLLALVLTLVPAAYVHARGRYPGWAAELALRRAGCTAIVTTLTIGSTALSVPANADAALTYLRLQQAVAAAGQPAPIHIVISGALPPQLANVGQARIAHDLSDALLARIINTVPVTPYLVAVSGRAALIPPETARAHAGSYTITFESREDALLVSLNLPGLR